MAYSFCNLEAEKLALSFDLSLITRLGPGPGAILCGYRGTTKAPRASTGPWPSGLPDSTSPTVLTRPASLLLCPLNGFPLPFYLIKWMQLPGVKLRKCSCLLTSIENNANTPSDKNLWIFVLYKMVQYLSRTYTHPAAYCKSSPAFNT